MSSPDSNEVVLGLSSLEQRLFRALLAQCELEHERWLAHTPRESAETPESRWIEFLKTRISQEIWLLEHLRRLYGRFVRAMKTATSKDDEKQLILNFARDLGASPADLAKDEAAFERWFGADAVTDRYHRRHAQHEQYMTFLLDRLSVLAASIAREMTSTDDQQAFWKRLQLETVVKPLLVHDGDVRLKLAAFRCLAGALSALAPEIQELAVDDTTLQYLYRSALQHQQDVWIQCAALELLVTLSWVSFEHALRERLLHPAPGDDIFVRRRAVQLLTRHFDRLEGGESLIPAVLSDPSAFVRQALPQVLLRAPADVAAPALEHLIVKDASPQVRAAAWLEWPGLLSDLQMRETALHLFRYVSSQETDDFVLRVICLVAERSTQELRAREDPFLAEWQAAANEVLLRLRCSAKSIKVRRWASQSLEFVWSECHPKARVLREQFTEFVQAIPREGRRRLPREWTNNLDPAFIGRVWSVVCRRDYDVQLQSTWLGYKVTRAHVFGFRWWRWWFEFRHPSPDKRQAFSHTIGRLFDGELHIPSAIMAELAQTKVPGEPLHISSEGGWRPFLPLPDELTSSIEVGHIARPFRIFTAEGITTVTPPTGWQRWRANMKLTWNFRHYGEKRNWLESMQEPPVSYVNELRELGFQIEFQAHPNQKGKPLPVDPMVQRFFGEPRAVAIEEESAAPIATAVPEGFRVNVPPVNLPPVNVPPGSAPPRLAEHPESST